eukprot:m.104497 g.104497  ORF g.104497 m.104497 type:complete len:66 (+) comp22449_c1_seq1:1403-1600(+)
MSMPCQYGDILLMTCQFSLGEKNSFLLLSLPPFCFSAPSFFLSLSFFFETANFSSRIKPDDYDLY